MNRFEDFKPEDIEWILQVMNNKTDHIKDKITDTRGDKCVDIINSGGFCFGKKALELGLVDSVVDSPEVYIQE